MKEVSGRLFALCADVARVGGIDLGDGSPPIDPSTRASYGAFVGVLDRLRDRLGGNQALADAFARSPVAFPELLVFATDFTSPLELSRFFNTVLLPGYFTCLHTVMSATDDASYDLWLVLHPGYAAPPSLVHALAGLVRGLPRHLELAEAKVVIGAGTREVLCQVSLPTGRGKARGRARMRAEDNDRANAFIDALVADGESYRAGATNAETLIRALGESVSRAPSRVAFAGLVVDTLVRVLGLEGCALWEPDGSACLAEVGSLPTERTMLDVRVAGADAARLDVPAGTSREAIEMVLPLVAWGLRACEQDDPRPDARTASPARILPSWKLTKRQAEVVSLVASGLSNGDIAARLGCAIGTVEDRLTAIYAKVGVDGRLSLAVRVINAQDEATEPPNAPD